MRRVFLLECITVDLRRGNFNATPEKSENEYTVPVYLEATAYSVTHEHCQPPYACAQRLHKKHASGQETVRRCAQSESPGTACCKAVDLCQPGHHNRPKTTPFSANSLTEMYIFLHSSG